MSVDTARLIRALTEPPGGTPMMLLGGDTEVARLATHGGDALMLVGPITRVPELIAQHRSGVLHLALVGGGDDERRLLASYWPRFQLSRRFTFHQVDANGQYRAVRGRAFAPLKVASARAPSLPPLTPEEAAALLDKSRATVEAEQQFAARSVTPWATIAIVAVCVIAFALEMMWGGAENLSTLSRMGANRGPEALRAPWTLLSSAFLHIGFMHLLFNMAALFSFGPLLERVLGARRYLLLYVASALCGGLVSALGHSGALVSAGASGAIWGLMVGGGGLALRPRGLLPPMLLARIRKQVWQPILINALYSFQPRVDWLCHFGGGLAGGLLVVTGLLTLGLDRRSRAWTVAAALAVVASLGSLGAAWAVGQPWELGKPPTLERQFVGVMGLSLEVPSGMSAAREPDSVLYGTLEHDPMLIEVRFSPYEKPPPAEQLGVEREELRKVLAKPLGGGKAGEVREETIGTLHTLVGDLTFPNGVIARTWGLVLPDGVVVLRVYLLPDAPQAWRELRDRIIRTLRTTGSRLD